IVIARVRGVVIVGIPSRAEEDPYARVRAIVAVPVTVTAAVAAAVAASMSATAAARRLNVHSERRAQCKCGQRNQKLRNSYAHWCFPPLWRSALRFSYLTPFSIK